MERLILLIMHCALVSNEIILMQCHILLSQTVQCLEHFHFSYNLRMLMHSWSN